MLQLFIWQMEQIFSFQQVINIIVTRMLPISEMILNFDLGSMIIIWEMRIPQ